MTAKAFVSIPKMIRLACEVLRTGVYKRLASFEQQGAKKNGRQKQVQGIYTSAHVRRLLR